ncbi:MAG: DUF962 domain-containing protein [Betaproteobacteria bacterium]|nr:DUF962 domain-containing protein [Betaproteobacteria bacterium]
MSAVDSPRRTVDVLLDQYGESHQNPTNKLIHWFCVPVIVFSVLGLLGALHPYAPVALMLLSLIYYVTLSPVMAVLMLGITAAMLYALWLLSGTGYLWQVSAVLFVAAWVVQFIGHRIEGKKPSFFQDVKFLLIGPLWLLGFVLRKLGVSY